MLADSNRSKQMILALFAFALIIFMASGIGFSQGKQPAAEPVQEGALSLAEKSGKETRVARQKQRLVDVNPAARVNGVTISRVALDKGYNAYTQQRGLDTQMITNPERYKMVQQKVLDGLIARELLWQEAQQKKFIATDEAVQQALSSTIKRFPSEDDFKLRLAQIGYTESDYREQLRRQLSVRELVRQDIAKGLEVSEDEIRGYYQSNPGKFKTPEQIRARHILVKVEPAADEAARQAAKRKIGAILDEVQGGADFAELARKHSQGPSGPKGGDLGFFSRGRMVKLFEDAAFALNPGEVSGVLQTIYGYHIIKVEEKRAPQTLAEKDVEQQIRQYLYSGKVEGAVRERVDVLRAASDVEILL